MLFLFPCLAGVPFETGQEWPRRESRSEINFVPIAVRVACWGNPPRPCASRRVEALNQHQTLQTSKTSSKPTKGRVYPPPTPSQTVRLARSQFSLTVARLLWKAKYVGKMCISCLWARLGAQVTPKSFQGDPKVVQSDPHTPKVSPI